jgi:predicted PurR-regulated permease PerM
MSTSAEDLQSDAAAERAAATAVSPAPRGASTGTTATISITQRTLWTALGLVAGLLVVILLLTQALGPLLSLLLAIILAEAIRPLVVRLERYRVPPALAVIVIYLLVAAVAVILGYFLLSPLISQLSSLASHLPDYQKALQGEITQLQQRLKAQGAVGQLIQNVAGALAAAIQSSVPSLLAIPFNLLKGILGIFIDLVIVLTMTLFWLLSSHTLKTFIIGLLPPASQEHYSSVIGEVSLAFGGYVRGTLISMVIIGTITGAGLALLGVPYALLLGVLAALTELLPYLGPWISGTVSVVLALIAVGPVKAIEVVILFILIQELEGNVVEPMVMSKSVHIDPLLVIVAVLIGINLLGIIGAVLAVPVAAGIQVLVVRVLAPFIRARVSGTGSLDASISSDASPPKGAAPREAGVVASQGGTVGATTAVDSTRPTTAQPPDAPESPLPAPA